MKKILLSLLILLIIPISKSIAVCPSTLLLKDAANVTAPAKYSDDGSGNCMNDVVFHAASDGGATPFHLLTAGSNNSTSIKSTPGTVYDITIINTTTSLGDFRFYDTSSAPTCSSSTGVVSNYVIQSNGVSPGLHITFPAGKKFLSGIGFCFTGANADNDNTNAFTGVNINIEYN